MMALPQKAENVTLGYVEVKPLDVQSDLELAFMDLVRLGVFARSLVKKISEHSYGITTMAELLTIDVPKYISEIGGLLQKVDDLKRLFLLYDQHMEPHYVNVTAPEDDAASTIETINPKRRKTRTPSFSLV